MLSPLKISQIEEIGYFVSRMTISAIFQCTRFFVSHSVHAENLSDWWVVESAHLFPLADLSFSDVWAVFDWSRGIVPTSGLLAPTRLAQADLAFGKDRTLLDLIGHTWH